MFRASRGLVRTVARSARSRALPCASSQLRRADALAAHALRKHEGAQGATYNPEWKPNGIEGGVDTHSLPWIECPLMPGCSLKPLRVSRETGHFTVIIKQPRGVTL